MAFEVETDSWPIVLLRPHAPWTLDEWRDGWASVGDRLGRTSGSFALLADARAARPPKALERTVVADFFSRHEALLRTRCVGLAVVVSNPVIRAAATAVFWVVKPAVDVRFFGEMASARAHLDDGLARKAS